MDDEEEQMTDFSPLLPQRNPNMDLFLCDVSDAAMKDIMPQMEHPFFSLSKRPDVKIREYKTKDVHITIIPSVKGMATIYDKDILIYCISQIMHKLQRGESVSQRVKIHTIDLLLFANRGKDGRAYNRLCEALDRLEGTRIKTNIRTGGEEQRTSFGLIDGSKIVRKFGDDGRLLWCEIVLSDWVFNAIRQSEVLTLHPDYFRLRKPIERRIYEIARKHCGKQREWKISLRLLLKKTGASSPEKSFRLWIRDMVKTNHLPDYEIEFDPEGDFVHFYNRGTMFDETTTIEVGKLAGVTYDECREVCPGWDPFFVESQWREWMEMGDMDVPKNPDRAFIGFARKFFEKRGRPR